MKAFIWIFLSGLLVLTSCNRNADDYFPYEEEGQEFTDDFGDFDSDGGGSDSDFDNEGGEGELSLYKVNGNDIELIKDYQVDANLQSFQDDKGKHQKMWEFTTTLFPIEERDKIVEFEVFHGGGELLGYVLPINENDLSTEKHHEETISVQKTFHNQVKALLSSFEALGNPFTEESSELLVLHSRYSRQVSCGNSQLY